MGGGEGVEYDEEDEEAGVVSGDDEMKLFPLTSQLNRIYPARTSAVS